MTTVVINCETQEVATDSQSTGYYNDSSGREIIHTSRYLHNISKLMVHEDTVFVGAGSYKGIQREWEEYVRTGCLSIKPRGDFTIALIHRKGDHLHVDIHRCSKVKKWKFFTTFKMTTETIVSNSNYITFGSGGSYAFGALKAGADVRKAVEVASGCDPYTDCNVQYYKFNQGHLLNVLTTH